jgi:hypothetical protein
MIPTLLSTDDHVAAGGLSYVGSREFEIETRLWSRRIDTMHTLSAISVGIRWKSNTGVDMRSDQER